MSGTAPPLTVTESDGRVRLHLGSLAHGDGNSLQDAGDDLVRSVLRLLAAFRTGGFSSSMEVLPDLETAGYLHELGEIAAAGGDIRVRLFG